MLPAYPDKIIIRFYAIFWVMFYLAIYFVFRDVFMERVLRDANRIQDIAEGYKQAGGGYGATAAIYALLPFWLSNAITGLFNAYIIYNILMYLRTFRSMIIIPLILLPLVMLDMQAPSKETIVLAMSLLLTSVAWRIRSEALMLVWIAAVYGIYGGLIRNYFLLIFLVFFLYYLMTKTQPMLRWLYVLAGLVVLLLLPEEIFIALGNARDAVTIRFYVGQGSVRTFFMNPFPSDSALHFIYNYIYAFIVLNFPFVRFVTAKELLLFINVLICGCLMVQGIRYLRGPMRMLSLLFAAHITIQIIFEPDGSSYLRHFGSVLLYLMPAWLMFEKKRVVFLKQKTRLNP